MPQHTYWNSNNEKGWTKYQQGRADTVTSIHCSWGCHGSSHSGKQPGSLLSLFLMSLLFLLHWDIIGIQHCVISSFWFGNLMSSFDACIYCQMIESANTTFLSHHYHFIFLWRKHSSLFSAFKSIIMCC